MKECKEIQLVQNVIRKDRKKQTLTDECKRIRKQCLSGRRKSSECMKSEMVHSI